MPVYEYECAACGARFSRYFKTQSAAAAPVACERCGAPDARRALSAFQVHQTVKSQLERLDPTIEKELDWADRHHQADDPLKRVNMNFDVPKE